MSPRPTPAVLTLPEVVAAIPALLSRDYDGVRSARVRDLPDVRTIRWYQSLGVLDRPTEFRGRAALYRRRHLLQIAVVKKLQASGLSLEAIQGGLPGKSDAELARALGLTLAEVDGVIADRVAARLASASAGLDAALEPSRRAAPFWLSRPADPAPAASARQAPTTPAAPAFPLQSKNVGGTVVVLWNGRPLSPSEEATLAELSAPLVAFLSSMSTPTSRPTPSATEPPRPPKEPRR